MKKIFLILAILTLSLTSCKKSDSTSQSTDSTKVADTAQLAPPPTTSTDTTKSIDVKPIATHSGVISTDMGDIEFELYGKDAPKAVENFAGLIKKVIIMESNFIVASQILLFKAEIQVVKIILKEINGVWEEKAFLVKLLKMN